MLLKVGLRASCFHIFSCFSKVTKWMILPLHVAVAPYFTLSIRQVCFGKSWCTLAGSCITHLNDFLDFLVNMCVFLFFLFPNHVIFSHCNSYRLFKEHTLSPCIHINYTCLYTSKKCCHPLLLRMQLEYPVPVNPPDAKPAIL